jgi:hypothetical protein
MLKKQTPKNKHYPLIPRVRRRYLIIQTGPLAHYSINDGFADLTHWVRKPHNLIKPNTQKQALSLDTQGSQKKSHYPNRTFRTIVN